MASESITWNGSNLQEITAAFGLGLIDGIGNGILTIRVDDGDIHVFPGDTIRRINGRIEVYSCLVFHPHFRRFPA